MDLSNYISRNTQSEPVSAYKIVKDNAEKYKILYLKSLEPGQNFSGLVYCLDSRMTESNNRVDAVNLKFKLIDGDGVIFYATMFDTHKRIENIKNSVLIIKSGQMTNRFDTVNYYNLKDIEFYTGSEINVGHFLKQLDNMQEVIEESNNLLNQLYNAQIYNNLKIIQVMERCTLANTYGTKIGSPLLYLNTALSLLNKTAVKQSLQINNQDLNTIIDNIILKIFITSQKNDITTQATPSQIYNIIAQINGNDFDSNITRMKFIEDLPKTSTEYRIFESIKLLLN